MGRDGKRTKPLDYRRPDGAPPVGAAAAVRWRFWFAYLLIAGPFVYVGMNSSAYPVPVERTVTVCVLTGIAVGGGLFVVRREPRNIIGWVGLVGWGGLCLAAIINALVT